MTVTILIAPKILTKKYFKALNFDLDTHQLQEHYPGANYRQAYDDLRRFFKKHQFSHRQGSGYISKDKLTTADIYDLMDEFEPATSMDWCLCQ